MRAKKKFGQNFLVNEDLQYKVADSMYKAVDQYPMYEIVEIGPGQGDLSQHFIKWGRRVTLVEIDPEAVDYLSSKFEFNEHFKLLHHDALKLFESEIHLPGFPKNFVLLSSLPYNVGSRILVDLPIYHPTTPFAVILQREVIHKLRLSGQITFFGSWLNLFWDVQEILNIPPHAFSPQPKVTSTLVYARPKQTSFWIRLNFQQRLRARIILKTLFQNPNKTLFNNLKFLVWDAEKIQLFIQRYGYDSLTRISWENYENILQNILNFDKA